MVLEPIFLLPIRFPSDNPTIRFHPDNAGAGTLQTVTLRVFAGFDYYLSGTDDPRENSLDLCRILENALNENTNNATERYVVSLSARNVVTITATSGNEFIIYWDAPLTTVDPTIFGWVTDTGSADPQVAPNQAKGCWIPGTATRTVGKRFDTLVEPMTVGLTSIVESGSSRGYDLSPSRGERQIGFTLIDRAQVLNSQAVATEPYGSLEHNWKTLLMCGGRQVAFFEDRLTRTQANQALYRHKGGRGRPWKEMGVSFLKRYDVNFDFLEAEPYSWGNEFAASFNGTTSYVAVPEASGRFDGLTNFTVAFWMYQTTQSSPWAIFGKWTTPAANSFLIQMNPSDEVQVALASSSADTGSNVGRTSSANLATGVWNHVIVRYEGGGATNADRLRFWVNGVEMVSKTYAGTIPSSLPSVATGVEIGRAGAVGRYFTGLLAHLAMYSSALSAADCVALYAAGVKTDPYTLPGWSDIIGYWPLNGHTRDQSGNSQHGVGIGLSYSTAV